MSIRGLFVVSTSLSGHAHERVGSSLSTSSRSQLSGDAGVSRQLNLGSA
jgi:hypothetical protein